MKDVMIDLETLGTAPGSVILSIGAVKFDPATQMLGAPLYLTINAESCYAKGLVADTKTLEWWAKQSEDAKEALYAAESSEAPSLEEALKHLAKFLGSDARVWGNGADFDNVLLSVAYAKCGLPVPWKFWNSRCYRTLKSLPPKKGFRPLILIHVIRGCVTFFAQVFLNSQNNPAVACKGGGSSSSAVSIGPSECISPNRARSTSTAVIAFVHSHR